jgi:AraC-like DNA-binding protein
MTDPLGEVVTLLEPNVRFFKLVSGAGSWRVRRTEYGQPLFCALLEGSTRLAVEGREEIVLQEGDFVLIPAAQSFVMTSLETPAPDAETAPISLGGGEFRLGVQSGPHDTRYLVGHCTFGSPDASLLVSLLPQLVHVRGEPRLTTLVELLGEESRAQLPAREVILARLLEVLLIESLRSSAGAAVSPGVLRGLADERVAVAIRKMHEQPTQPWTVAQLAKESALSRSTFFERFGRAVGIAPMEYLLAWRMALAKNLLRRSEGSIAEVAERVGYRSASSFSVAFSRHFGMPPTRYVVEQNAVVPPSGGMV